MPLKIKIQGYFREFCIQEKKMEHETTLYKWIKVNSVALYICLCVTHKDIFAAFKCNCIFNFLSIIYFLFKFDGNFLLYRVHSLLLKENVEKPKFCLKETCSALLLPFGRCRNWSYCLILLKKSSFHTFDSHFREPEVSAHYFPNIPNDVCKLFEREPNKHFYHLLNDSYLNTFYALFLSFSIRIIIPPKKFPEDETAHAHKYKCHIIHRNKKNTCEYKKFHIFISCSYFQYVLVMLQTNL